MNIENLQVGMVIKNYKELCLLLGVEQKSGGRNQKLQMEDFKRYFNYEKDGRKIIIKEIYDMPIEKKSGNNNTPYIKYIENLVLDLLVQSIGKNDGVVFLSKNKLFKEFKMTNENYAFCKNRTVKLSKLMNIEKETVEEWFLSTDGTLKRNLERALDNLKKQSLILWSSEITVCKVDICNNHAYIDKEVQHDEYDEEVVSYNVNAGFTLNHREATESEKKAIIHAEREVMMDMGFDNKQDIVAHGEWENFKNRVYEIILRDLNVSYYYDSYKILFNEDHIQGQYDRLIDKLLLEKQEREDNQNKLNKDIIKRLKDNTQKKQNRALSDNDYLFGNSCSDKISRRIDDDYIDKTNKLVDSLINKDYKNIKNVVRRTKI